MKKLLYTTTAFVLCGGIVQANAACIATPSCYDMGYTSTSSCEGGLKCPFGSYWYCPSNSGEECADFPYLCFGRGYVDGGGIGADCNGKYAKCECYEGFEWQDGKGCVEVTDCRIGSILFSDKSCSMSDIDVGTKTPIGVVVYTDGTGHGQAMSLKSLGYYIWSRENVDISSLTNYKPASDNTKDYDSCGNTTKIMAAGDKNKYAAAWAAHEYSTEGTSAGDWCLPAAGILESIDENRSKTSTGFKRAKGDDFTYSTKVWSSTEYSDNAARSSDYNADYGLGYYCYISFKDSSYGVRPVLEF